MLSVSYKLQLRASASTHRFAPPSKLIEDAAIKDMKDHPDAPIPVALDMINNRRMIQRRRAANLPPHPKTLHFTVTSSCH